MAFTVPTIAASGLTFAQMQGLGLSGHLETFIAALTAGTLAPTAAPTLSATGGGSSGGNLAAGTYYVKVTETNGIGETTASPEASVAIAAGNIPQVTFAALKTGNLARNVFVGAATGAEVCYARGITASTYNLSAAIPTNSYAVAVPTMNSTGLANVNAQGVTTNSRLQAMRAVKQGRVDQVVARLAEHYRRYMAGDPIAFPAAVDDVRHALVVLAVLVQLATELGAAIDANPGHLTTATTGIGLQRPVRVWP